MRGGAAAYLAFGVLAMALPARADIEIVGTGDGEQVLRAVAVAFRAHGGARVLLPPAIGTSGAIAAVGSNQALAGRISRKLTAAERANGLVEQPLYDIDIAVITHPALPLTAISSSQLAALFSGAIGSWRELAGPDLRVKLVTRHDHDAALAVLRAGMPGWRNIRFADRAAAVSHAAEAVETVRREPGSIAFVPFSATLAQDVRVVAIDGREPGRPGYPYAVRLALVYKPERLDEQLKALIDFAGHGHGAAVASELGARQVRP
jgi:phosphate transport system substrate-binding protein